MHCPDVNRIRGFSILDLLILLSVAMICIVIGTPLIAKYSVKVRMAEAISEAERAQSMITMYCAVSPSAAELSAASTGFVLHDSEYVKSLQLSGPCSAPAITVVTRNTGVSPDPTIILAGARSSDSSLLAWTCSSNSTDSIVAETCRDHANSF
jgi:Tfp pilus assembly major pilin PilA